MGTGFELKIDLGCLKHGVNVRILKNMKEQQLLIILMTGVWPGR